MGAGVGDRTCRAKINCIFCQSVELRVRALQVCRFYREVCFFCEGRSIGGYGKSVRGLHVFVEKTIYLKISYIFCQSVDGLRVHALQVCQIYRKSYFFYEGGR